MSEKQSPELLKNIRGFTRSGGNLGSLLNCSFKVAEHGGDVVIYKENEPGTSLEIQGSKVYSSLKSPKKVPSKR